MWGYIVRQGVCFQRKIFTMIIKEHVCLKHCVQFLKLLIKESSVFQDQLLVILCFGGAIVKEVPTVSLDKKVELDRNKDIPSRSFKTTTAKTTWYM